ncbi:hypothetical protein M5K25_001508 [Dendrobium thyrsiflorum]|uniref:Uncharacterized protein n=1 Tax=Dendrobium thyrsiflorum TaxID=117978 RepID=A0ABD0VQR4_DENTH
MEEEEGWRLEVGSGGRDVGWRCLRLEVKIGSAIGDWGYARRSSKVGLELSGRGLALEVATKGSTNAPNKCSTHPEQITFITELPAIRPYLGVLDPASYTHSSFRLELREICFPMLTLLKLVDLSHPLVAGDLESTNICDSYDSTFSLESAIVASGDSSVDSESLLRLRGTSLVELGDLPIFGPHLSPHLSPYVGEGSIFIIKGILLNFHLGSSWGAITSTGNGASLVLVLEDFFNSRAVIKVGFFLWRGRRMMGSLGGLLKVSTIMAGVIMGSLWNPSMMLLVREGGSPRSDTGCHTQIDYPFSSSFIFILLRLWPPNFLSLQSGPFSDGFPNMQLRCHTLMLTIRNYSSFFILSPGER